MRRLILLALVAGALAHPPTRRWLADVLITTGCHLGFGPPVRSPDDIERGRAQMLAYAEAMGKTRNANGHGPAGTNDQHGGPI